MKELRIGVRGIKYAVRRNIRYSPVKGVNTVWVKDPCGYLRSIQVRMRALKNRYPFHSQVLDNLWVDWGNSRLDLMHFFNIVSLGRIPWIVTTEGGVPRMASKWPEWLLTKARKAMLSDRCMKIIAISCHACETLVSKFNGADRPRLEEKLTVLHPPQHKLVESCECKPVAEEGPYIFTFIGRDFFMKGGAEILSVFDRFLDDGAPLNLNIVSGLSTDTWCSHTDKSDVNKAKALIEKHPLNIRHFRSLPNSSVLELLKHSHAALLPTYQDTYGYAVLEAQACGCPVISTDIQALPEINNDRCGWVIHVPKDSERLKRADYRTAEGRLKVSQSIETVISTAIDDILHDPCQVYVKGEKALERITECHDPLQHSETLRQIYYGLMR